MSSTPHYVFAHRLLPSLTFSDPNRLIGSLAMAGGAAFLRDVWGVAEKRCGVSMAPEGLRHTMGRLGDDRILVCIHLPEPQAPAEAHFVAVVAWLGPAEAQKIEKVRVITLEKAAPIEPGVVTYLGEWLKAGTHHNLGPGPKPDHDAFIAAVVQLLG
jgi:hypothetical protein